MPGLDQIFMNPMFNAGMAMLAGSQNQVGMPRQNLGQIGMLGLGAYGDTMRQNMLTQSAQSRIDERKRKGEKAKELEKAIAMFNEPTATPQSRAEAMNTIKGAYPELVAKSMLSDQADARTTEMRNVEGMGFEPGSQDYQQQLMAMTQRQSDPLVKIQGPDGKVTYVPRGQAVGQQAPVGGGMSIYGYDAEGRPLISMGGSGMPTAPTKTTQTKLQAEIVKSQDNLALVDEAIAKFDPQFQTYEGQFSRWLSEKKAKLGVSNDKDAETLSKATDHRSAAARLTAETMHDLTGAAQTQSEYERMKPFLPAKEDDPISYKKKLDNLKHYINALGTRLQTAQQQGISWKDIPIETVLQGMVDSGEIPPEEPAPPAAAPPAPPAPPAPAPQTPEDLGEPTGKLLGKYNYWIH